MGRFIRYMASTDDSPIGVLALEYMKALARCAPVRLVAMTPEFSDRWSPYAVLLGTAMWDTMVNVVCCAPQRWTWVQTVALPTTSPTGQQIHPVERVSRRVELYTPGCRNVLLSGTPLSDYHQVLTAQRYDALVVPTEAIAEKWRHPRDLFVGTDAYFNPIVIPVPVVDHEAMRRVVFP